MFLCGVQILPRWAVTCQMANNLHFFMEGDVWGEENGEGSRGCLRTLRPRERRHPLLYPAVPHTQPAGPHIPGTDWRAE